MNLYYRYLLAILLFEVSCLSIYAQTDLPCMVISEAQNFAKDKIVLKIFTDDSTWKIVDKQRNGASYRSYSSIFKSHTPLLFYGKFDDDWFLLVEPRKNIKISLPEGYDIEHIMAGDIPRTPILAPEIFRLKKIKPTEGIPKEKLTRLYNPIKGEFITDFCQVNTESVSDFLITELYSNDPVNIISELIDLKNNRRFVRPRKQNDKIVYYRFPGEDCIVFSTYFPGRRRESRHDILCDRELNPIFELPDDWIFVSPMREGLACIRRNSGTDDNPVWEYGAVDQSGKIRFRGLPFLVPFNEGLACFGQQIGTKKTNDPVNHLKYGYINPDGDIILAPTFDRAINFRDGTAFVEIFAENQDRGQIFQIDKTGKKIREIKTWTPWLYVLREGVVLSVDTPLPGLYDFDENCLWHADNVENVRDLMSRGLYGFPD
jgi:hypothetical protein